MPTVNMTQSRSAVNLRLRWWMDQPLSKWLRISVYPLPHTARGHGKWVLVRQEDVNENKTWDYSNPLRIVLGMPSKG